MSHCIFCFKHYEDVRKGCSYGLGHEYPNGYDPIKVILKNVKLIKVDNQLCVDCGLHWKNPISMKNGCEHGYQIEV